MIDINDEEKHRYVVQGHEKYLEPGVAVLLWLF